jgi:protein-ribulosamine 3-kinase
MNINSEIKTQIEKFLNEKIVSTNSVSGGCIADSKIIHTESGDKYFLKTLAGSESMFLKEANGLNELSKPNAIKVPKVILADKHFLLLEAIEQGSKSKNFFHNFGESFALMHKYTSDIFGFFEDNYIGATPQLNIPVGIQQTNWSEFYFEKRILQQYKFAEKNGYATNELSLLIGKLENKIETILSGSEEAPTLLHGDLWGGNYMCDISGEVVLIDPAVYYGHREADLAMTKMFGGFTSDFYRSYQNTFPLKDGWEFREDLYLLYHYMNHLNLFGQSYYSTTVRLLNKYI